MSESEPIPDREPSPARSGHGHTQPFFSTEAKRLHLLHIARTWLGTPFVPHAGILGAGVDCVHLCGEIYIETGALELFDPPKYTIDGGPHGAESLIGQWAMQSGRFISLPVRDPLSPIGGEGQGEGAIPAQGEGATSQPGDCLAFKIGRRDYHVGIQITDRTFIHAARGFGVIESNLYDPTYMKRLSAIYRPVTHHAPRTTPPA